MQHGVMDRVRDGCGFQKEHAKKSRSGPEHVGRASEREGSRKDLASTRALCPRAHSVLFQKTDQTEKKTRRNQSRYSDWRYRWKQLNVYTKCMFHLKQVWRDGKWETYGTYTEYEEVISK